MIQPPSHPDEQNRLATLHSYNILDTLPESTFDDITRLAAFICGTPIAMISLIDDNRQWFKSTQGLDIAETSRDEAFCAYTILSDAPMVVPDAQKDARFADNPLVTGDIGVRFYAGAPLVAPDGQQLGALCVLDQNARQLTHEQIDALTVLSHQVMMQIELRQKAEELERNIAVLHSTLDAMSDGVMVVDNSKHVTHLNNAFTKLWKIPTDIANTGERSDLMRWVVGQFDDAQEFVRAANAVYDDPEASTEEMLYPKDGRVILRYSHPQRYNNEILGRVVGFRDITVRVRAEAEQLRLREEVIVAQNAALAELSTPLIPLTDHAVMMPLIGAMDSRRAQQVVDTLLDGVSSHHAEIAILDITGVQVVDTQVAQAIARAAQAVQLLGARVVITGIRPEVAQTLVSLQVDFGTTITRGTLQEGIRYVLTRME